MLGHLAGNLRRWPRWRRRRQAAGGLARWRRAGSAPAGPRLHLDNLVKPNLVEGDLETLLGVGAARVELLPALVRVLHLSCGQE